MSDFTKCIMMWSAFACDRTEILDCALSPVDIKGVYYLPIFLQASDGTMKLFLMERLTEELVQKKWAYYYVLRKTDSNEMTVLGFRGVVYLAELVQQPPPHSEEVSPLPWRGFHCIDREDYEKFLLQETVFLGHVCCAVQRGPVGYEVVDVRRDRYLVLRPTTYVRRPPDDGERESVDAEESSVDARVNERVLRFRSRSA